MGSETRHFQVGGSVLSTIFGAIAFNLALAAVAASDGATSMSEITIQTPAIPQSAPQPRAVVTAEATARITILSPVIMRNGQSDAAHSVTRGKVQDAAGNWREIEVLDFQ